MVKTAADIWDDYVSSGVPSSGRKKPNKADIRELIGLLEKGIGFATVAIAAASTIAAPIISIEVRGHTVEGIGGSRYYEVANSGLLRGGQFQSNSGARRWQIDSKNAANILCHGAAVDGVTECSAAFAAAISCCNRAWVPTGTFVAQVVLYHDSLLEGESRYGSIIKTPAGADKFCVAGNESYTMFGSGSFDINRGANRTTIRNISIDGNRANVTSTGEGIAIWGYGTTIENVSIRNCRSHGLRTEWTDGGVSMEGHFQRITIDTVGGHGWLNNGPHDCHADDITIVDASQNADNGYRGLFIGSGAGGIANGRFFNCHVWHRSGVVNRCEYALYSSGTNEFSLCHFEGCRRQVRLGARDLLIGCTIYAPFGANGAALLYFGDGDALVRDCKFINGSGTVANPNGSTTENPDTFAISFGAVAGNTVIGCVFQLFKMRTPFDWGTSIGLNSIINCIGYAEPGGATAFGGTMTSTDYLDYYQTGTSINYRKPPFHPSYSSNAAAASAGVPVGGIYQLTTTNALTVRV